MLPVGVTGTNEWKNPSHGTCAAGNVDNDNGDTDYCYETTSGHEITFTMADPSVAESAISSIQSVKITMSTKYTATSGFATRIISSMTGTGISNGTNTHFSLANNTYATTHGALEAYATGTTNWTYTNLEDLKIKLDKYTNTATRTSVRVSYLYVTVVYVPAGYGNSVMGVDSGDIASINGIAAANIEKVNGV
jgi:hypothetical protein